MGLVLVDDRGALAVVAHPGHQILQARAAGGREVVPGVPEIMKVQARRGRPRRNGYLPGVPVLSRPRSPSRALRPAALASLRDGAARRSGL